MSGIVINIKATAGESSVTATGELVHIIADSERASFGIGSDADLKRVIEEQHQGKQPNYAFLKGPTSQNGDIYDKNGWSPVQTVLQPIKAEILEIKTKPTILSTNILTNESSKAATYSTKISERVTDTVAIEWSNSRKVSVDQAINYSINLKGTGGGGETRFRFEHAWGKNETVTKQMTASMETGVTVDLKPGESASVELSASLGTVKVRITYEAHLTGFIAVIYNKKFKDNDAFGLDVEKVLKGSNKVEIVEDIEVCSYSNATAILKNAITK